MRRIHIGLNVKDLDASVRFYSDLFGAAPSVRKDDYAKWMLDDPRVNFAISSRGGKVGVNHLGLQTDSDAELELLNGRLQQAELATQAEKEIACCYARSNKYWVTDPTGIAWETFHTLGSVPTFDEEAGASAETACCAPQPETARIEIKAARATPCCG